MSLTWPQRAQGSSAHDVVIQHKSTTRPLTTVLSPLCWLHDPSHSSAVPPTPTASRCHRAAVMTSSSCFSHFSCIPFSSDLVGHPLSLSPSQTCSPTLLTLCFSLLVARNVPTGLPYYPFFSSLPLFPKTNTTRTHSLLRFLTRLPPKLGKGRLPHSTHPRMLAVRWSCRHFCQVGACSCRRAALSHQMTLKMFFFLFFLPSICICPVHFVTLKKPEIFGIQV